MIDENEYFRKMGDLRFQKVLALREELETKLEAWRQKVRFRNIRKYFAK